MSKPRIVVRADSIFQGPLLDTENASAVEFYDCNGDLVAIFGKILSDDFWGFSTVNDPDWEQVMARMGYASGTPTYEQAAARLVTL